QNEGSPVYKSDLVMITRKDDTPDAPFEAYDATMAGEDRLWSELDDPSWSRRYAAHVELLRRGGDFVEQGRAALGDAAAVAHQHLKNYEAEVFGVATISDPNDPATVADYLSDHFDDPLDANAGLPTTECEAATSTDTLVRQLACLRLAERGTLDIYRKMIESQRPKLRLGGVLAAGFRLTVPRVDAELAADQKLDKLQTEAPYTVQYADETIDLRTLGPVGVYTVADHWKQATHTDEQEALFALLLKSANDADESVRLQAVHFLSLLNDPRSEPTVNKVVTANEERRLSIAKHIGVTKVWLAGPFDDADEGFARPHGPELGPIELSEKYAESDRTIEWNETKTQRQFNFATIFGKIDHSSTYAYFRVESGVRQRAHLMLGSDDGVKVWHNGKLVWTNDVTRGALPLQDVVPLELMPGSNDVLIRVRNVIDVSQLYINFRSLAETTIVLPEKISGPSLAERLASSGSGSYVIPAEFFEVDWREAAKQGNVEEGRRLFESVGCAKCHALSADEQSGGGPSLADAARRFTIPYLVESILAPNKQISPVFRATQVITTDGRQVTGLLVAETAEKIELLLPDTKRTTIAKDQIDERALQNLSPMPQGVVRKPQELRDILAYVLKGK
ncbi:MAG TPA: c-type cytochrome, partial [Pirellulales bacterium]|nr:c-type cytochrome [Pirellulales bacterium]